MRNFNLVMWSVRKTPGRATVNATLRSGTGIRKHLKAGITPSHRKASYGGDKNAGTPHNGLTRVPIRTVVSRGKTGFRREERVPSYSRARRLSSHFSSFSVRKRICNGRTIAFPRARVSVRFAVPLFYYHHRGNRHRRGKAADEARNRAFSSLYPRSLILRAATLQELGRAGESSAAMDCVRFRARSDPVAIAAYPNSHGPCW